MRDTEWTCEFDRLAALGEMSPKLALRMLRNIKSQLSDVVDCIDSQILAGWSDEQLTVWVRAWVRHRREVLWLRNYLDAELLFERETALVDAQHDVEGQAWW